MNLGGELWCNCIALTAWWHARIACRGKKLLRDWPRHHHQISCATRAQWFQFDSLWGKNRTHETSDKVQLTKGQSLSARSKHGRMLFEVVILFSVYHICRSTARFVCGVCFHQKKPKISLRLATCQIARKESRSRAREDKRSSHIFFRWRDTTTRLTHFFVFLLENGTFMAALWTITWGEKLLFIALHFTRRRRRRS